MEITNHLKHLLYLHDCVVVPGLGGFVCTFHKFEFNIQAGYIQPARRSVAFNPNLTATDNLFAAYIAEQENSSLSQAGQTIQTWVQTIQQSLQTGQPVVLQGIGSLQLNTDKNIIFTPNATANFLAGSYGFNEVGLGNTSQKIVQAPPAAEIIPEPVAVDKPTEIAPPKPKPERKLAERIAKTTAKKETKPIPPPRPAKTGKRSHTWRSVGRGILFFLLLAALFVLQDFMYHLKVNKHIFEQQNNLKEQINPPSTPPESNSLNPPTQPVLQAVPVESLQNTTNTQASVETNGAKSPQTDSVFYIIAGAFKSEVKANTLKKALENEGFAPQIIKSPGLSLYRVGYAGFSTRAEAKAHLKAVRQKAKNPAAWVLGQKK